MAVAPMDEIRLIPCPKCGGLPVVLIRPFVLRPALRIECSVCGNGGPWIYFDGKGALYQLAERMMLPDLVKARRLAAADWNGSGRHEQD